MAAPVFGVMKYSQFEEIQEYISEVFRHNHRATLMNDHFESWFDSYESWNDLFEVFHVDDSAAKATIKLLANVSSDYDSDFVYVGNFADAVDLAFENSFEDEEDDE
jgi:hypothetical protein